MYLGLKSTLSPVPHPQWQRADDGEATGLRPRHGQDVSQQRVTVPGTQLCFPGMGHACTCTHTHTHTHRTRVRAHPGAAQPCLVPLGLAREGHVCGYMPPRRPAAPGRAIRDHAPELPRKARRRGAEARRPGYNGRPGAGGAGLRLPVRRVGFRSDSTVASHV